jgi:hypothetical protein
MKFVFALLVSTTAFASESTSFVKDNDLWKEDCLACERAFPVTQDMFNKICDAGLKAYTARAQANNEKLVINKKWTDKTVNADACRGCQVGEVTVNMYGGLARRQEMSPEGFALVLGHELSHAYGGTPYIDTRNKMAAEGQSDWMSTKEAYKLIAKYVPELKQSIPTDPFISNKCGTNVDCIHSLEGGKSLGDLLARLSGDPLPNYETPDKTIVTKTQLSYPATTQCRVDSYLAGTLNLKRSACWFKN